MQVPTRKVMALGFSGAYIALCIACVFWDKEVPTEFIAIVSTVVGYYFGKSTALDTPGSDGGD